MTELLGVEYYEDGDAEHSGVKGMKWGVRRDKTTGARPIAVALNNSRFGKLSEANLRNYQAKQAAKGKTVVAPALPGYAKRQQAKAAVSTHMAVKHEKRIQQLERVAAGAGSRLDNIKVATFEVSVSGRSRNDGLAGGAANKAANMRARDARREAGESTVKDYLARFGGDRIIDTGRPDKSRR